MLEKVVKQFDEYIKNYDMSIMEISMKYHHSFTVSKLMGELAFRLNLNKEQIELARIIGMLHDIGRFEQFMKDGVLTDEFSDHADESVIYLFDKGHIRDFVDTDRYDEIIKKAIKYHNKLELPDDFTEEELLYTKMIRDMDKVDIYKQFAVNFNFLFNASEITESVLMDFKDEKCISSDKVKNTSDRVIQILAFIFDINFDESFDILVSSDNFDLFLSTIEVESNSEKIWKKLRELCFDKINRGADNV